MLTGSSNVVQSHHSLTSTLEDVVERRTQGSVAALFDVDNTLLPGEASEVRFFRFLWRRGLVGWSELTQKCGLAGGTRASVLAALAPRTKTVSDRQMPRRH